MNFTEYACGLSLNFTGYACGYHWTKYVLLYKHNKTKQVRNKNAFPVLNGKVHCFGYIHPFIVTRQNAKLKLINSLNLQRY